jgi:heptosyltransferase-2
MNPSAPDIRSNPPRKLLVRGVNWLGDAVMSTPALLRLREAAPSTHITLLTPEKLAGLWTGHPAVNSVLTFADGEGAWRVARRLKAEQFDLSLILPNSARSALESFLAGIPQRIGYGGQWRRLFLTCPVPPRPGAVKMRKRSGIAVRWLLRLARFRSGASPPPSSAHHIHQYLHLIGALGGDPAPLAPQLFFAPDEIGTVLEKFGIEPHSTSSPLLGLNAGAEYGPAKRWPEDRFAAAAMELQRRTNCRWIVFGGRGDAAIAGTVADWLQSVSKAHPVATHVASRRIVWNLAGQTSLRELGALLKACRVLLTNDTGPMHLAAAAGTPVVALFGSTSPELTGPGLPGDMRHALLKAGVPCAPCFRRECPVDFRCMTGITVEQVVDAVFSRLDSITDATVTP